MSEVIENAELIVDDKDNVSFRYVCPFCGTPQAGTHNFAKVVFSENSFKNGIRNACLCAKCKKKFYGSVKIQ